MKRPQISYACLELEAITKRALTKNVDQWHPRQEFILQFFDKFYQVRGVKFNKSGTGFKKTVKRVYEMFIDGPYLKIGKIVYACNSKEKHWQEKALLAAGHSKEEITANKVLMRLTGSQD